MPLNSLTAISPIDGRYHEKTRPLHTIFSEYGLIHYRLQVEIHWLICLANEPKIKELTAFDAETHERLMALIENFSIEEAEKIKQIEAKTNHDVKAVEYYLKERLSAYPTLKQASEFLHFACTSEDINNVAYAMMIKKALTQHLFPLLQTIMETLTQLATQYANQPMLSRTHGQPATPTTLGKEMANFVRRLQVIYQKLVTLPILAKFNGAVGNYNAHHLTYSSIDWPTLAKTFIENLDLTFNTHSTQIESHDYLADLFHKMSEFNTVLIDCCRDMWGYIALDYFQLNVVNDEVGSSTMPHKINPIDFENAEGNCTFANAVGNFLASQLPLSRFQRDLTDSTLMRNVGVVFAHSSVAYQSLTKGLNKLRANKQKLEEDLEKNWPILAEAVQTVMRRYGLENPYEQLKAFTRGQSITKADLHRFIQQLDLPSDAKQTLLDLTPRDYTGIAGKLSLLGDVGIEFE